MKSRSLENKCATQHIDESDNDNISGCHPLLPDEIIIEILSWLSVDALLRAKCVCKSWCATIQEHYFNDKHRSRAQIILLYAPDGRTDIGNEKPYSVVRGLVVEKNILSLRYRVRNPSTKQKFDLPNPRQDLLFIGLFFLPTSNDYKAVYIHHKEGTTGAEVLTIGTDHAWRSLHIPNLKSQRWQILRGSIAQVYFVIGLGDYEIICVDMETESYTSVEIPKGFFSCWKNIRPLNWGGKLALASIVGGKMLVWVLENYKNQKWANKKVVIPLDSIMKEPPSYAPYNLIPHCKEGDLIWFHANYERLLAYNIRTNSVSTVAIAPTKHNILYVYHPSLYHIKGMTPVEHSETSS